ncbi:hypothetical protein [Candidatus Berkiella aquae]|uniref:Uncharacterized protein n=1 Tax=Candidatus Berkiella aquae TaxID=295108 RepID=A0A0Q9YXK5_9GAMM|nr:hypothetical protein [Candidatus Berkiella aquae]MCS5712153.1 hypothetical protein [Candidatus Berkiella aquae]
MTKGPIVFTQSEKTEFNPLFLEYAANRDADAVLEALNNNQKKYERFTLYADGLLALLKERQKSSKIDSLTKNKTMLTQSIKQRKQSIDESREITFQSIHSMTGRSVKVR